LDLFQKYKHDHIEHHGKDIDSLSKIKSSDDIKENTIATLYLNNKYNLRMSSIPFELFFQYIQQDHKFLTLIRIVNQYFNIHVVTGKLTPVSAVQQEQEGILGHDHDQIEEFHEINNVHLEVREPFLFRRICIANIYIYILYE
jgi:transcription initiation factor TFIID subunit 5